MKLIIDKNTNRVINDYLLINNDFDSNSLFDSFKNFEGIIKIPTDWYVIEAENDFYNFEKDKIDDGYTNTYYYIDEEIVLKKIIEPEYVLFQINKLTLELQQTDYKIIKSYEAQLIGNELPYDINEVHYQRQAIRDKINEFELLIKDANGRNN